MAFKLKSEFPHGELPLNVFKSGQMRVQRPVVNAAKCAWCGSCHLFCPTGCLIDKDGHFEANLDYCKGCGICAQVCPVQAIAMVREEY
ncbi:MAG: 4Fe-4S binding protein [Chloroflexi bacterium]|nr:4Fe-4S binding protein [Chloroflexota bacterium]